MTGGLHCSPLTAWLVLPNVTGAPAGSCRAPLRHGQAHRLNGGGQGGVLLPITSGLRCGSTLAADTGEPSDARAPPILALHCGPL